MTTHVVNKEKPHDFTVRMEMDSYSDGVLNQKVGVFVTEYARTGEELTVKQMAFTRDGVPPMIEGAIKAFDNMSQPFQQAGMAKMLQDFEEQTGMTFGEDGQIKPKGGKK